MSRYDRPVKQTEVIPRRNVPASLFGPVRDGLLIWLMLDRLQAGPVTHAVLWTLYAVLVLFFIAAVVREKTVIPVVQVVVGEKPGEKPWVF